MCSDGAAADGGDLLLEELIGASCVLALVARASPWHAIALAAVVTDMACALHTCRCEWYRATDLKGTVRQASNREWRYDNL